jgi:hypothetical protein
VGFLKPFASTSLRIGLTNPSKTFLEISGNVSLHQSRKSKAKRL